MKKIVEYLIISVLFIFSLIYTENAVNTVKKTDPIMKDIVSKVDDYTVLAVDATINNDTIIPGVKGCTIDINKSYENMKKINQYNESMIKYKDLIPKLTIDNIYDKYIISGNDRKKEVAIVINATSIDSNILNTLDKLNIFVSDELLENIEDINNDYIRIYNGGVNNNYDDVSISWMNDVINDKYNKSNYCINKNRNNDNLEVCSKYKMHTISPKVTGKNTYEIKEEITNGSIIYFDDNTVNNLKNTIKYLYSKGYKIVFLDELLNEKYC